VSILDEAGATRVVARLLHGAAAIESTIHPMRSGTESLRAGAGTARGACALDSLVGCLPRAGQTVALAALLALAACGPPAPSGAPSAPGAAPPAAAGDWQEFEGSWSASGTRHVLRLDGDRRASVSTFNGSLVLSGSRRPAVGFRAEAIAFNDTASGMEGRAVWIDERGERIFSELKGQVAATGHRVVGTIVGGTGRYAGVTGGYEFTWRFVLEAEDGTVQGQSMDLKGRVRRGAPAGPAAPAAPGSAASPGSKS
jgi:hypothetical protein